jgi:hypothetical protein
MLICARYNCRYFSIKIFQGAGAVVSMYSWVRHALRETRRSAVQTFVGGSCNLWRVGIVGNC